VISPTKIFPSQLQELRFHPPSRKAAGMYGQVLAQSFRCPFLPGAPLQSADFSDRLPVWSKIKAYDRSIFNVWAPYSALEDFLHPSPSAVPLVLDQKTRVLEPPLLHSGRFVKSFRLMKHLFLGAAGSGNLSDALPRSRITPIPVSCPQLLSQRRLGDRLLPTATTFFPCHAPRNSFCSLIGSLTPPTLLY